MTQPAPFWKTKTLEEMTPEEWESLCDGCGRCCTSKMETDDTHETIWTDIVCRVMDKRSCKCSDYANRSALVPWCNTMDAAHVRRATWLPSSCGYRRVRDGRDLAWWHPLISGDPETVHIAGISVRGRVVSDLLAAPIERHAIIWQDFDTDDPAGLPMHQRARFGGVNAAVPTPFLPTGEVDGKRLAQHCLWLLGHGSDALVLFSSTGEGAALHAAARLEVVRRLIAQDVPVSRLWPVCDSADPASLAALVEMGRLGVRGALLQPGALPPDWLARDDLPLLYPTLAPAAVPAWCVIAEVAGERLGGVFLSEATPATVAEARATLAGTMLCGRGPEVYIDATGFGVAALAAGAAGVITPLANIAGRLLARLRLGVAADPVASEARLAGLVGAMRGYEPSAATKALLARAWRDTEWERPAPGARPLSPAAKAALYAAVDAAAR
ncbi:MAG: YcgN family cysteine cluster protein [Rhodospirillales bacterium]|nr:YcgN family cysteine cluster protein [Rhodospirillales bacterium]